MQMAVACSLRQQHFAVFKIADLHNADECLQLGRRKLTGQRTVAYCIDSRCHGSTSDPPAEPGCELGLWLMAVG